jgi:hypothetical protein
MWTNDTTIFASERLNPSNHTNTHCTLLQFTVQLFTLAQFDPPIPEALLRAEAIRICMRGMYMAVRVSNRSADTVCLVQCSARITCPNKMRRRGDNCASNTHQVYGTTTTTSIWTHNSNRSRNGMSSKQHPQEPQQSRHTDRSEQILLRYTHGTIVF